MNVVYTTIQAFIEAVIGVYSPVGLTMPDGSTVPIYGIGAVDFNYIVRACVLLITIYGTYKIIGGIICRNF